jgi:hypothetical protein
MKEVIVVNDMMRYECIREMQRGKRRKKDE